MTVDTGKQFSLNMFYKFGTQGQTLLLTSTNQSFIMMQHYKEIGFRVPSALRFMGLGERNAPFFLNEGTYALFTDHNDF